MNHDLKTIALKLGVKEGSNPSKSQYFGALTLFLAKRGIIPKERINEASSLIQNEFPANQSAFRTSMMSSKETAVASEDLESLFDDDGEQKKG